MPASGASPTVHGAASPASCVVSASCMAATVSGPGVGSSASKKSSSVSSPEARSALALLAGVSSPSVGDALGGGGVYAAGGDALGVKPGVVLGEGDTPDALGGGVALGVDVLGVSRACTLIKLTAPLGCSRKQRAPSEPREPVALAACPEEGAMVSRAQRALTRTAPPRTHVRSSAPAAMSSGGGGESSMQEGPTLMARSRSPSGARLVRLCRCDDDPMWCATTRPEPTVASAHHSSSNSRRGA